MEEHEGAHVKMEPKYPLVNLFLLLLHWSYESWRGFFLTIVKHLNNRDGLLHPFKCFK